MRSLAHIFFVAMWTLFLVPAHAQALDLSESEWRVCLPTQTLENSLDADPTDCPWHSVQVPSDLFGKFGEAFRGWAVYRTEFSSPAHCLEAQTACSLVLGEVGDSVELFLNGVSLGRRGDFPPHPHYAKQYPVRFDLPRQLLKTGAATNELRLVTYSLKLAQSGVRKGPVKILESVQATRVLQALTAVAVVLPVVGSLILLVIGCLYGFSLSRRAYADASDRAFTWYCFAASLFLFSFSELPREYLPIGFAGYLHFSLRVLFDASLFWFVGCFFEWRKVCKLVGLAFYGTAFVVFWAEYALELSQAASGFPFRGFDLAYITMRISFPLLVCPPLVGLISAITAPVKPYRKFLIALFGLHLAAQVWDVLIFNNVVLGTYLVKFYPLPLGLAYAWVLLARHQQKVQTLLVSQQKAQQAAQVAHDIRSPLTALNLVLGDIDKLPESHRILIRGAVNRINDIANHLVSKETSAQKTDETVVEPASDEPLQILLLTSAVETIVTEKRMQYRDRRNVQIEMVLDENAYGLFASVQRVEWMRVVSNLISNSVEAIEGGVGWVTLSFEVSAREITLRVRDNGKGMQLQAFRRLQEEGGSFNKVGGKGLGLSHARNAIKRWGGKLDMQSAAGQGTEVSVVLPRAAPPYWFVPQISLGRGDEVVAVDDDDSIHQVWKKRLSEWAVQRKLTIKHFTSPNHFLSQKFDGKHGLGKRIFLVDFEFIGESLNGLDVIEKAGLVGEAVLVTSRFAEPEVLRRCERLGVKLLPKNLAALVPIGFSG